MIYKSLRRHLRINFDTHHRGGLTSQGGQHMKSSQSLQNFIPIPLMLPLQPLHTDGTQTVSKVLNSAAQLYTSAEKGE